MVRIKSISTLTLLIVSILILFFACNKNGESNHSDELIIPTRIDQEINKRIQNGFEKKIHIAEFSLENPVKYKFYGNNEDDEINNLRFEFGSITKTFTSLLIYKYQERGVMSYDDKIVKYLPDSVKNVPNIDQIEIRHLLNHTSGLPWFPDNYDLIAEPWNNPFLNFKTENLMSYLQDFSFPDEREFQYSNLGYGILSYIVEEISKQTLLECFKNEIVQNLETNWDLNNTKTVQGFDWNSDFNNWNFPEINYGVGGLRGTINNLAAYGEYVLEIIQKDKRYLNTMFSDTIMIEEPFVHLIGKAWYTKVNKNGEKELMFHGGWTGGFNSQIVLNLKENKGVAILSNTSSFVDDIAINYFDSTFSIRTMRKDFSWKLNDELNKGVNIQKALNSIENSRIDSGRLLELSRYYTTKNIKNSIAINDFIIKQEPENWKAHFEQGKCYLQIKEFEKSIISFNNSANVGGDKLLIGKQIQRIKNK